MFSLRVTLLRKSQCTSESKALIYFTDKRKAILLTRESATNPNSVSLSETTMNQSGLSDCNFLSELDQYSYFELLIESQDIQ